MSKEIVFELKYGGIVYAGDTYRYNHFTKRFELLNGVIKVAEFHPSEVLRMKVGKISESHMDNMEE